MEYVYLEASYKGFQATEEASSPAPPPPKKRTSSTSNVKFLSFFSFFVNHFCLPCHESGSGSRDPVETGSNPTLISMV
jgi:hypothetical protein